MRLMMPVALSAQPAGRRWGRGWEVTLEGGGCPRLLVQRDEREGWSAFSVGHPSPGFPLSPSAAMSMNRQGRQEADVNNTPQIDYIAWQTHTIILHTTVRGTKQWSLETHIFLLPSLV